MAISRKGILLAGGKGTRLHPLTMDKSKHLLPIGSFPMLAYSLCTLLQAEVREILIVTNPEDLNTYQDLFGDGFAWGCSLHYKAQAKPEGIAQALLLAKDFLQGSPCVLALGDNLFSGPSLKHLLQKANAQNQGATLFTTLVSDPEHYGIAEISASGKVVSLEEKPCRPRSCHAVTGLYFYDEHASSLAESLQPSERGELEITDLNRLYLEQSQLTCIPLPDEFLWMDLGTLPALKQAEKNASLWEQQLSHVAPWVALQKKLGPQIQLSLSFLSKETFLQFPEEGVAVQGAIEKRVQDFSSGRAVAHKALRHLGAVPHPLLSSPQGSPLWPKGYVGSISHTKNAVGAVVGKQKAEGSENYLWGVGLDLEVAVPLPEKLHDKILTSMEKEWIQSWAGSFPKELLAKAIFCLKEAAYKCMLPCGNEGLGFQDVSFSIVESDPTPGCFTAKIHPEENLRKRYPTSFQFQSQVALHGETLLALVSLNQNN